MSNPYFNFRGDQAKQGSIAADDGAGQYAEASGQLLTFTNNRDESSVSFIAFLNSFSQAFQSNWNAEEVIGRMDSIATFKNTQRTVSVAWELPASNAAKASENLERCNKLISMLYPTYLRESATVMAKSPLVRIKFANLITTETGGGQLGYVTSLNWNPVLEMGYYETAGKIFPKVISLSIEFTVLHKGMVTGFHQEGGLGGLQKSWPFGSG